MADTECGIYLSFSGRELQMIRKVSALYEIDYGVCVWRDLLDQWHWWAANWRKHPGYFLGEVGVLSFEKFLERRDIAERGRKIYEKMATIRRGKVSRRDARAHD